MQQTSVLLNSCSEKYKRAYIELKNYLFTNNRQLQFDINNISDIDFKISRGILYSFFDSCSILVSVSPHDITKNDNKQKCRWSYLIALDDTEIIEGHFKKREEAEYIAFLKCFQFLDTKLFIKQTKDRFYDETSDTSCLNVNWVQLNRVLSYKRKNLLT
jgi:hypothetical protein